MFNGQHACSGRSNIDVPNIECRNIVVPSDTVRVSVRIRMRGWGWPSLTVKGRSNVSERRPCKGQPSDTFDHTAVYLVWVDLAPHST